MVQQWFTFPLLVGTSQGLFSSHDNNLFSEASPALEHDEILALASGLKGRIWIGAEGNVFRADAKDIDTDGRFRSLEPFMEKGNGIVTSLFEDRDGDLWIGEPEAIERFQTMRELESDADEIAIADARRLVAATSPETVQKVFSFMNP